MKNLLITALFVGAIILIVEACDPPRSYPDVPEVEFKSLNIANGYDDLGNQVKRVILTIRVTDGDGDIGIKTDNNQIYPGFEDLDSSDLHIDLYEKIDGVFQTVDLINPHHFGTPYLEPEGQDKTLKANLEITLDYPLVQFDFDTIKYTFFIYDRKLHKSNEAESPSVPWDTTGIIQ